MSNTWMDVDAAVTVPVNAIALVDDTDFKTREESVTFDQAGLDLVWNFITTAGVQTQTAVTPTNTGGDYDWVNVGNGMYNIELPASGGASVDNDTEGFGWFTGFATGILPWAGPIIGFRAAVINDVLVDSADGPAREGSDGSTHTLTTLSSQIGGISGGGSAQSQDASAVTLTTGTQTTGTFANTSNIDGVYHGVTEASGTLDYYYTMNIGTSASPVSGSINGRLDEGSPPSGDDTVDIIAWNNTLGDFEIVKGIAFTGVNGSTSANDTTEEFTLFARHVDSSGDVKIGIRRNGGVLETGTEILIDQAIVNFTQVGSQTGYINGAYWIKATGVSGTTFGVNGTVERPCPYADALTMNATNTLNRFEIASGETVALTATSDNFSFFGTGGWTLQLESRSIEAMFTTGALVTGTGLTDTSPPVFNRCAAGAVTIGPSTWSESGIGAASGTFTGGGSAAGDYVFADCVSLAPGAAVPAFNFAGRGAATGINNRRFDGGGSYTVDSDCTISVGVLAGGAQTFISSGADIELRGRFREAVFTLSAGGTTPAIQMIAETGDITISGTAAAGTTIQLDGQGLAPTDTSANTTVTNRLINRENWIGGDYSMDTDVNGAIRIVDGTGARELNTNAGTVTLTDGSLTAAKIGADAFTNAKFADNVFAAEQFAADSITADALATDAVDEIVDGVWDEVLSTSSHNTAQTAGKRLRQITSTIVANDTAEVSNSPAINQIQLASTESAVDGTFDPALIGLIGGTGAGQSRLSLEYDGTSKICTLNRDWKIAPDITTEYIALSSEGGLHVNEGLAQGGGPSSITLNTLASSVDNLYNGQFVFLVSGPGQDQVGRVTAYNGTTKVATIMTTLNGWASGQQPTSATGYIMIPMLDTVPTILGTPSDFGSGTPTIAANLEDMADNGTASYDRATDSLQAARDEAVSERAALPTAIENRQEMDSNSTQLSAIVTDTGEIGTAGAGLTAINLPNQTMDIIGSITGSLSGSVGSVTGAVGSVTADVTTDAASRTASKATGFAVAGDAMTLTVAERNASADALLIRDVDQNESGAPEHCLTTVVLATLESSIAGTVWTIKQTDGSTTHVTKTVAVDEDADPITGVS